MALMKIVEFHVLDWLSRRLALSPSLTCTQANLSLSMSRFVALELLTNADLTERISAEISFRAAVAVLEPFRELSRLLSAPMAA